MNKNTSVSLGAHFTNFVEMQVGQGRYGNASDVLRAGLRLLEEQEARLALLRNALIEGEESGLSPRSILDVMADEKEQMRGAGGE